MEAFVKSNFRMLPKASFQTKLSAIRDDCRFMSPLNSEPVKLRFPPTETRKKFTLPTTFTFLKNMVRPTFAEVAFMALPALEIIVE